MQLNERVERIERSMRRWRAGAVLATLGFACALASGAAKQPTITDEVNTRLLRVYDAKGRVVFIAGSFTNEATMVEIRRQGETAMRFQAEDGANIMGLNRPGRDDAQILMGTDATSGSISFQSFLAGKGTPTAIGSSDGKGYIQLRGPKGETTFVKP